jgi:diguanylate cyclase (GGDEF)-like protein
VQVAEAAIDDSMNRRKRSRATPHGLTAEPPPSADSHIFSGLSEADRRNLHILSSHLPAAVWATDNVLSLTWIDGGALPAALRNGTDLAGQPIRSIVSGQKQTEDFLAIHRDALNGHEASFEHYWHGHWYLSHVAPLRNEKGAIVGTIGVSQQVALARDAEERATYESRHDPLTGLPNRLLLQDRLSMALAQPRNGHGGLALVSFDLDELGRVNDTLGLSVGDLILREIAERLAESFRDEDTIAKIGGDQFALLIPGVEDEAEAVTIAERLLALVRQPVTVPGGDPLFMSTNVGIAICTEGGESPDDLLQSAEGAMYRSKEEGRNTFRIASEEASEIARARMEIETGLYRALGAGELSLHYQPVLRLHDRSIAGVEALIRWDHPSRGLLSAAEFIHIAEESAMMSDMGDWVLRTAILQAAAWRKAHPTMRTAINVSAHQFHQRDLPQMIRDLCESCDIPPSSLEIEITESAALLEVERTAITIARLRELGSSVAIDDFGTGFSSLVYLKRFPITAVKIDRGFVRDMGREERDLAIIHAILAAARALGLRVVAEGIEDEEQAKLLLEAGCEEGQGYLFGRPGPAGDLRLG